MAKLGYTWFPQDWWTSETFKRLKRFPMVRYAIRELFDLMYKEGDPVEMSRAYLEDDFNIDLSDEEYDKLMEYITIYEDGKWWIKSIRKRLTKAQAARINGQRGGRPKKTQKPNEETQENPRQKTHETEVENPKNPPYIKQRERENKRKEKENKKEKITINDTDFYPIEKLRDAYLENPRIINAVICLPKNKFQSQEEISKRLEVFNQELKSKGTFQKTWEDYTAHFLNWHRKTASQSNGTNYRNIPVG